MLRRVAFIVFAQRLGMSLHEVRRELDQLPTGRIPTGSDWSILSAKWVERIDRRIEELERLKLGLSECVSCGCPSMQACKLVNPDDRAARTGPGPRFWVDGEDPSLDPLVAVRAREEQG